MKPWGWQVAEEVGWVPPLFSAPDTGCRQEISMLPVCLRQVLCHVPGYILCVTKGLRKVITNGKLQIKCRSYGHAEGQHSLFLLSWLQWPCNNRFFPGVGAKPCLAEPGESVNKANESNSTCLSLQWHIGGIWK